ncbi:ABC transporter ATP-binding protein [Anaerocolumna chitinilytica]|uniref:ABC transporter domain-containing protein n=1 Tax=Anaerocolumna chitinilytica TaxID=1727145 RepID=A0A7I8DVG9_9FIRM|nr:hypothetical protein bsdcttw_41560 [Anaerocolumna chitinilytica]
MINQAEKIIEVKNVKKIYRMGQEKIYAVDDVSFDIYKGEFCCLLGTSGSGKSTLLNLMAGIEKISGGQIIIKGKKIHKMNENNLAKFRQRYLGFVFQSYNLIGSMTALENVEFPLIFKRVKAKQRRKMARDMLKQVGLEARLNHKPKEMSGGQQQRVGIARAFVASPEIVFADEPTGNLDTKTTMDVMKLIRTMAKQHSQTIVMVTHDRRLADFADRIIHILDGKIQEIEVREVADSQEEPVSSDVISISDNVEISDITGIPDIAAAEEEGKQTKKQETSEQEISERAEADEAIPQRNTEIKTNNKNQNNRGKEG